MKYSILKNCLSVLKAFTKTIKKNAPNIADFSCHILVVLINAKNIWDGKKQNVTQITLGFWVNTYIYIHIYQKA